MMSLMEPFVDKGYYLFMDNYYTYVGLFEELEEWSTHACGTVRFNRVDLPREICNLKSRQVKELKRGESLYRQKGILTCVTWRDRRVVSMLATVPTSEADSDEVERSVKARENEGTEREAQGVGQDMSCPRKLFLDERKSVSRDVLI